ncbi:efflux transporter outer membrane subunit [Chitinimonas naiadis]
MLTTLLGACATVGPDYQTPALRTPASWQAAVPHGGRSADLLHWWQSFNDPVLDSLLARAEADSPSLDSAWANIMSARASVASSKASGMPTLSSGAGVSRAGNLNSGQGSTATTSNAALDASWEIDLFGGLKRSDEAARARASASVSDWHDARVSLAAEVANEYVSYRACQLLLASYQADAESRKVTGQLTGRSVAAGFTAQSDADLADAGTATAISNVLAQQAECELDIKSLVALTGMDEPELRNTLGKGTAQLPKPASLAVQSLPTQLVAQRPDLAAKERNLAAASADIGVAEANRYPRLSLLGSISSAEVRGGSSSTPWSLGPSLSLPLFDGGSRRAAVDKAQAGYDLALATYRQGVLDAVKEVEQALVRLDAATRSEASRRASAEGYQRYLAATRAMWQAGSASLLTLEQAQRDARGAEQTYITSQRDRILNGIALYKALGGGWDNQQNENMNSKQENRK